MYLQNIKNMNARKKSHFILRLFMFAHHNVHMYTMFDKIFRIFASGGVLL